MLGAILNIFKAARIIFHSFCGGAAGVEIIVNIDRIMKDIIDVNSASREESLTEFFRLYASGLLDYKGLDIKFLVKEMLRNIGSTNIYLREYAWSAFEQTLCELLLNHEEHIRILNLLLGREYLFKGIGDVESDTVFCRSWTSISIEIMVRMDTALNYLPQERFIVVLEKTLAYMEQEADRRGWVPEKGWAHAPAHGADLLCSLIGNPKFSIKYADKVLEAIKCHIAIPHIYGDGEYKRLANVVPALISKGFDETVVKDWINNLTPDITKPAPKYSSYDFYKTARRIPFNIECFLHSLCFALEENCAGEGLRAYIVEYWPSVKQDVFNWSDGLARN